MCAIFDFYFIVLRFARWGQLKASLLDRKVGFFPQNVQLVWNFVRVLRIGPL